MPFNPEEYGVQPLAYEMDGQSGNGLDAMAVHMEAARLAGQAPNMGYVQNNPGQVMYAPAPAPVQYQPASPRMHSIDMRLRKAQYYRALMDGNLFEQEDPIAYEVEREIKDYIVSRMEALVGEDPTKQSAKFTDDEVKYLKVWAQTLKAKADQARTAAVPAATPTVRPVAAPPPQPVAPPAPPAPAAPAVPSVRRKRAPTVRMPDAVEAQPQYQPQASAPVAQPAPQAPAPRPGRRNTPGKARPGPGSPQPLPVPSGHQMEAVMAQKAMLEAGRPHVIETNPDAQKR